jgi:hypothetical protein
MCGELFSTLSSLCKVKVAHLFTESLRLPGLEYMVPTETLLSLYSLIQGTYVHLNVFPLHHEFLLPNASYVFQNRLRWKRKDRTQWCWCDAPGFWLTLIAGQTCWLGSRNGQPGSSPRKPHQHSPISTLSKSNTLPLVKTLANGDKPLDVNVLFWNFGRVLQILSKQ